MARFVVRRLFLMVPYILAAVTIVFILSHVVPADPVRALLGVSGSQISTEQVASMKRELGLDRSLVDQYAIYLKNLVKGDLGTSFRTRRPVLVELVNYFPATLELTLLTGVVSITTGVLLGLFTATTRSPFLSYLTRIAAVIGSSAPLFWVGLLLQLFFYGRLHWLPFGDRISQTLGPPTYVTGLFTFDSLLSADWARLVSALEHLILPVLALSLMMMGLTAKITQNRVEELLRLDFVRTARGKGLPERVVLSKHVFRNTLVTLVNVWALEFGRLLGGAVAVEMVFSYPGIGQFAVQSIVFFDFPAITGITILSAVIFLLAGLLADIASAFIDPTIRYS